MRHLGVLDYFAIARLSGHFWSRGLQQNVVLWLHFKCILDKKWFNLRQGVCSLFFWGVSLGDHCAKSQKVRDLGVLAKFAIAQLYGHFSRRTFQQNVVLWLHFRCILIRRWCDFREGVLVAYIFKEFPLVATLKKSQKMRDWGVLAKFAKARLYGHFWSRSLQQNVML